MKLANLLRQTKKYIPYALVSLAFLAGCASSTVDYAALEQLPPQQAPIPQGAVEPMPSAQQQALPISTAAPVDTAFLAPRAIPPSNLPSAPRFDDKKPHEWGRLTPWHYPIHGTDVSRYQGDVDWGRVRDSGISFVFIKATEGGDLYDENFRKNWEGTREVGLKRGAYHFYYWCRPARDQAQWFIRHVPRDANALPPVLDLEWNHRSPSCPTRPSPEAVRQEVRTFLTMIERHYGKKPIIYTTIDFFDRNDMKSVKGYQFWLRSVAGHPEEKYGPHPWTFWQYTGTGVIPGIKGNADINVFYGNRDTWKNFTSGKNTMAERNLVSGERY